MGQSQQLVQAAAQETEHKPGVQLLKPLQPVLKSGDGKENGPRPTQDSLGDLRQSAREQAAINSGVAGVGLSAAEAELVAVAGPPPPPPDPYEEVCSPWAPTKHKRIWPPFVRKMSPCL
jgi:hypothetical protein